MAARDTASAVVTDAGLAICKNVDVTVNYLCDSFNVNEEGRALQMLQTNHCFI